MNRPNIVFILIDDLGWRDLSCTGSGFYETPNIDRFREQGMRFTRAYAAGPVCSPTRASLLSGKYPAAVGVTDWINHERPGDAPAGHCRGRLLDAPYLDHLPLEECSPASALREGGYQTWHVGKWHLGREPWYPENHGFEVNIGGCHQGSPGRGGYFSPWSIDTLREADVPEGTYLTDYLTDKTLKLLRDRDRSRPFFLNLWYYSVHTPIEAKADKIQKYKEKAKRMGLDVLPSLEIGDFYPCEHKKSLRIERRILQSDPVYAAMIESLDENIGRLMEELISLGLDEETLVIFSSDNGGLSSAAGSPTCNLPLAEGKGWMYEGGLRVPLLIRWPHKVRAGSLSDTPVNSPDLYPTLLEAAGLPLRPEQHRDGESLLPLLEERGALKREALYWHYPHYGNNGGTPGSSILTAPWKLIEFFEHRRIELYNLDEDPGEQHDLSSFEKDRANRLLSRIRQWRAENEARIPVVNPDFIPWSRQHRTRGFQPWD